VIELQRRCSSGSMSNADEPSSVRPIRVFEPQASWVLGAGVETALWASPWTVKAEWLYISSIDFS